ncbi:MAG: outer membrane protein assembly factor BamC [Candidatus Thiodiazotropha sp. 6PLUC2]
MRLNLIFISLSLSILSLSGCSSDGGFFSDSEREYRTQQETVDDLEIPPDLTSQTIQDAMAIPGAGSASYEEYASQRDKRTSGSIVAEEVLPEFEGIRVERDGDKRWLVIDAEPRRVWPKVVAFWRKNGLLLIEQNPKVGVMKTDWLESRADIKQGFITEFFRKALGGIYSSATRDQFRVRLDRGLEQGTTELYLTHRGLEEKLKENISGDADTTYWTPRPNDPEVEASMLRSLMVHLGVSSEKAKEAVSASSERADRSRLLTTGELPELWIDEEFARAWRLTGVALDRVGFAVEDRDRSNGTYFVRYSQLSEDEKEDEGFLSKLAFWSDDEEKINSEAQYQVKLLSDGTTTQVVVRNEQGGEADAIAVETILGLIHEQIR